MSLYFVAVGVLYPIGAVLQGRLADAVGLRWVTGGSAVLLAATILGARLLRPGAVATLDADDVGVVLVRSASPADAVI